MSSRLVSAKIDVKKLIAKAEAGDVTAALELARTYKCDTVEELLGVLCPLSPPSVPVFDVAADAIALLRELARPAPALSRK